MKQIYRIGILAGMGPRSTTPFLESVLDECERQYGAKWDNDFPHMMVYSLPTPFHPKKPLNHNQMVKAIQIGIEALVKVDCDIIAIPCNSAHLYYPEICNMTSIPVLNIIHETMECLNPQVSKVSLLATRGTIESGLYQEQLKQKNKTIYWNEGYQEKVDELILMVKGSGVSEEMLTLWKEIESILIREEVTEVISACTDLFFCREYSQLKIYDSSKILARSLVKRYMREGLTDVEI
ncbi:aspartate/glutamate racemase family protein [Thermoflavimicrobium daqui]|nr:aspartate/glutamate racemase family protein [Thermoflavimicrobium daqui]